MVTSERHGRRSWWKQSSAGEKVRRRRESVSESAKQRSVPYLLH